MGQRPARGVGSIGMGQGPVRGEGRVRMGQGLVRGEDMVGMGQGLARGEDRVGMGQGLARGVTAFSFPLTCPGSRRGHRKSQLQGEAQLANHRLSGSVSSRLQFPQL